MIVGQIVTLFVVDFLHFVYAAATHLVFHYGLSSNATSALVFAPVPRAVTKL